MTARERITKARTALLLDQPFFGTLALKLKIVEDPKCGTAWVDGVSLGYNPKFVDELSDKQVQALLAHEVMHCALGHPWRREGRARKNWNIACDKAINTELRKSFVMPPDAYYCDREEVGKSAEWIYARLEEQKAKEKEQQQQEQESEDEQSQQDGSSDESDSDDSEQHDESTDESEETKDEQEDGPSDQESESEDGSETAEDDSSEDEREAEPCTDRMGEVRDAPIDSEDESEDQPTEQQWKQATISALNQSGGLLSGEQKLAVNEAVKAKTDVRSLLMRFVNERSQSDYTWTRPNKRFMSQGLYLPSLENHELGELAIAVDTSGSVDTVGLGIARGHIEAIIGECHPKAVTVYYFDVNVHRVDRFEQGEMLTWRPQGGGGTSFINVLKRIEDDAEAVCAIVITDMYGTFPDQVPTMPVMWLATTSVKAPFGETVEVHA